MRRDELLFGALATLLQPAARTELKGVILSRLYPRPHRQWHIVPAYVGNPHAQPVIIGGETMNGIPRFVGRLG